MALSIEIDKPTIIDLTPALKERETLQCHFCPAISKHQARRNLEPTLQKIYNEIQERFHLLHILPLTAKNCLFKAKQQPILTIGKLIVGCLIGYGLKNVVEGIISGEILFKNVPFSQVISSDKDTRINAGGLLTNAANNASFTMDGIFLLYTLHYLFFRNAYRNAASEIIAECYCIYLQDHSIPKIQLDELYDIQIRELKNYGGLAIERRNNEITTPPLELNRAETFPENYHICYLRSKPELRRALEPTLQKIHREMKEKFGWLNILSITLKNCFEEIKEKPILAIGKIIVLFGIGYMLKNIFEGIYSGEELFYDVSFFDNFSSNKTTQTNAAGLLTNAGSNVSFTVDGVFLLLIAYRLFFERAYNKAARGIINECYNKFLDDISFPFEESNELYEIKNQELDGYGGFVFDKQP